MDEPLEILITEHFDQELISRIQQISPDIHIEHHPAMQASEIPDEIWEKAQVLYTFRAIPEPEQVPNLQWLQYHLAGVDRLLESDLVKKEDLKITTLSGANALQVAEHAMALLLAMSRQIPALVAQQLRGQWMSDKNQRYQPKDLRGSTVGIVGYGSIGRQLAYLLQPFEVRILTTKRNVMEPGYRGYAPDENIGDPQGELFTRLYPIEALRSMFSECDYVLVTIPLTDSTKGLVGESQLAALKPGAILVDVSRGGIVDHDALIIALQEEKLGGAALDVFPSEPLPTDSPMWEMPNVLISPHVAGYSQDYSEQAVALFIENLKRFLDDKSLFNELDPELGY